MGVSGEHLESNLRELLSDFQKHLSPDIFSRLFGRARLNRHRNHEVFAPKVLHWLRKIGYSGEEVEELADSGFAGVTASDLEITQDLKPSELGSMLIDEFRNDNPPVKGTRYPDSGKIAGHSFLVDANYHALFISRPIKDWALYGSNAKLVHPALAGFDPGLEAGQVFSTITDDRPDNVGAEMQIVFAPPSYDP